MGPDRAEAEARRLTAAAGASVVHLAEAEAGQGLIRVLDWDTRFFGFPCAVIEGLAVCGDFETRLAAARIVVGDSLAWAADREVRFIAAKAAGPDPAACQALEASGFYLVDQAAAMTRRPAPIRTVDIPDGFECTTKPLDPDRAAEAFFGLFYDGRFYQDPRIDRNAADRLWASALRNQIETEAEIVVTLTDRGAPAGVATFKPAGSPAGPDARPPGSLFIFGLRPEYRGRGLGAALLSRALAEAQDRYDHLALETSTYNRPALGLYSAFGFAPHEYKTVFHHWPDVHPDRNLERA
jgi:GNAT superfamily N-acetyltransferase